MRTRIFGIGLLLFLFGCVASYSHNEIVQAKVTLDPTQTVLISVPPDASYGPNQYSNSGRMTANAIRSALEKKGVTTQLIDSCHGVDCLQREDITEYGYYIKPEILHWEDRATEWSGKRDQLEIQVVVFDALTGKELANSKYNGKSKWATFGGDHPQDLLLTPTEAYINTLFSR